MKVSLRNLAQSYGSLFLASFADIPITSSDFWQNEDECTEEVLKHVFRSSSEEEIPMFQERLACLREAGQVLYEVYDKTAFARMKFLLIKFYRNTNAALRNA